MVQHLYRSGHQRQPVERLRGRKGQGQRRRRLKAHGVTCSRCGRIGMWESKQATDALRLVVDHIVPLALGGADEDSNTRVLCEDPCHRIATAGERSDHVAA